MTGTRYCPLPSALDFRPASVLFIPASPKILTVLSYMHAVKPESRREKASQRRTAYTQNKEERVDFFLLLNELRFFIENLMDLGIHCLPFSYTNDGHRSAAVPFMTSY